MPPASSFLVVLLGLVACIVAWPGWRAVPLPRWRLVVSAVLVAAAALTVVYLPPHNDLRETEIWLVGLPFIVAGIGRGAWIGLQVDHGQGKLLLARAPEEFWIAVARCSSSWSISSASRSAGPGPSTSRPSSSPW